MDHSAPAVVPASDNGESSIHSSPRSNIDSFIESVQARSMASTSIRLGNKLAKPLNVEQPPSSTFTFAITKPAILGNISGREKGQIQEERNVKLSSTSDTNQRISPSKTVSRYPEKILNLSEPQEILDALPKNSISAIKQTPPQPAGLIERKPSEFTSIPNDEQIKVPAHMQTLRMSATNIDTPTLMKILAFTYHQETKQQNELITNLRIQYDHKVQELSATEAHCQTLEQSVEELHDQANVLKAEIDSLKQQLKDTQQSVHTEIEIVHHLKTIHGKLDTVLQGKRKEHAESVELGKALGVIRQMADELRQYRSQTQKVSPQKITNVSASQSVQTGSDLPAAVSGSQLSGQGTTIRPHPTDTIIEKPSNKQQSEPQEKTTSNKQDTQDIRHPFRNDNDAEYEEHSTETFGEQQDGSLLPIADSTIPNISSAHPEIGRHGVNKFGKRNYADMYGECSQISERKKSKKTSLTSSKIAIETPSKKACLRSANHSLNTAEVNSSQKKIDNKADGPVNDNHEALAKGKSSRGSAAKWRTIFDLAANIADI